MAERATEEVDILVVGFGAAGACTAFQAMEDGEKCGQKLDILIAERFEGGGATSRSGGIVYLGGGTDVQKKLGINDDAVNMYRYLKYETGNAVSDETLWRFCKTSASTAAWLRDSLNMKINVPDETAVLCPFKTSNAPDKYSVFYSGSETAQPFASIAKAVPRGHKAMGPGNLVGTGNVLFEEMERTVLKARSRGIRVETQTKTIELIWNESHTCVVGAKLLSLAKAPLWVRSLHYALARYGGLTNPFPSLDPHVARAIQTLELKYGDVRTVMTRRGVVLCAGGFCRNQDLVSHYVPKYAGCMPIGSSGDDGNGIFELGIKQANAKALNLNNASAWKFIVPASSMAKGVLVNAEGLRIINEDVYGARLAEVCMLGHAGKGFLIVDQKIYDECKQEVWSGEMLAFQKGFTYLNLDWNRVKAESLKELARLTGASELVHTVEQYNKDCEANLDTKFGKQCHLLSKLSSPPYYAIRFHSHGTPWVTPFFTLGGLAVNEVTGQVLDKSDRPIPGLFAAGRNASGVCSKSYVSGLSLADCVFSGRRAGTYLATGQPFAEDVGPVPSADELLLPNMGLARVPSPITVRASL